MPTGGVSLIGRAALISPLEATNLPPGGGLVGFETDAAVRGFLSSDPYAQRVIRRLIARRPGPSDSEASIRWGGPSRFEARAPVFPTVTVNDDDDQDDVNLTVNIPVLEFTEDERTEEEVRVENPDDSEQYVIVARATEIIFRGPDLRPEGGVPGYPIIPKTFRFPYIFYKFIYNYPEGSVS